MSVYLKRSKLGEKNIRKEQNEGFKLITSCLVDQHSNRRAAICDSLFFTKLDICGFFFLFKSTKKWFSFFTFKGQQMKCRSNCEDQTNSMFVTSSAYPNRRVFVERFFLFFPFFFFSAKNPFFWMRPFFTSCFLEWMFFFLQMFSRGFFGKEISREALNKKIRSELMSWI